MRIWRSVAALWTWSFVIGALSVITTTAQEMNSVVKPEKSLVRIQKIINANGWDLPPLGTAVGSQSKIVDVGELRITLTQTVYEDSPLFAFSTFASSSDGTLFVNTGTWSVQSVTTYRSGERQFGRLVRQFPAVADNGKIKTAPLDLLVFYVDEEGNGSFKAMHVNKGWIGPVPPWAIPDWIKADLK
ncbi:MAG: hypothetical protein IPN69_08995 [Acidobacteria bacterium]|nr:hypothetical protein [Acidobacteriota bacterium]